MHFKNEAVEAEFQEKVNHIKSLLDAPVDDAKYLWNDVVHKYATKIEQIQRIISDEVMEDEMTQDLKNLRDDLNAFLGRCASPEFHIALVGTVKAGKSTLINALLNYELAQSERVIPETAALTKFKRADEDYVEITFYDQDEWEILWKDVQKVKNSVFMEEFEKHNAEQEKRKWIGKSVKHIACNSREELKKELEHWNSSASPAHYFVKEVLVGIKEFDLPEGVVLVDTPGLNDVVAFRSNITRAYINRANAVLMCIKSDTMTGEELQTCIQVFTNARNNVEKVYIIATQLDTLNRPVEDWADQQKEWTKYLKGESCFRSETLANQNLIPVSAYLYMMMEDYKENRLSKEDEDFKLTPVLLKLRIKQSEINERYDEIVDFANIKTVKSTLQTEIILRHKELLLQDISASYGYCVDDIIKIMEQKKAAQEKLIQDSQKDIDAIRKQRDEYTKKLEQAKADKSELETLVKQANGLMETRIKEISDKFKRPQ